MVAMYFNNKKKQNSLERDIDVHSYRIVTFVSDNLDIQNIWNLLKWLAVNVSHLVLLFESTSVFDSIQKN